MEWRGEEEGRGKRVLGIYINYGGGGKRSRVLGFSNNKHTHWKWPCINGFDFGCPRSRSDLAQFIWAEFGG